jgi:hypothetical protein
MYRSGQIFVICGHTKDQHFLLYHPFKSYFIFFFYKHDYLSPLQNIKKSIFYYIGFYFINWLQFFVGVIFTALKRELFYLLIDLNGIDF